MAIDTTAIINRIRRQLGELDEAYAFARERLTFVTDLLEKHAIRNAGTVSEPRYYCAECLSEEKEDGVTIDHTPLCKVGIALDKAVRVDAEITIYSYVNDGIVVTYDGQRHRLSEEIMALHGPFERGELLPILIKNEAAMNRAKRYSTVAIVVDKNDPTMLEVTESPSIVNFVDADVVPITYIRCNNRKIIDNLIKQRGWNVDPRYNR